MDKSAFILASIEGVASELESMCRRNGITVRRPEDFARVPEEVAAAAPNLLLLEGSLLSGVDADLVQRIRARPGMENLFIVPYGPAGGLHVEGANATLRVPFEEARVREIFKRAFNLPKQVLLLSRESEPEFGLALRAMGYRVQILNDPELALNGTLEEPPDLLVAEYLLRGMDAVGFFEKSRENETLSQASFAIAYDGREAETIDRILKTGVEEIILSPFVSPRNLKKLQDAHPLPPRGGRYKALVVEDSSTIRSLIASMFRELDYEVKTAENGFEGYKAVLEFEPDVITTDYDMPILDGWEFASEVRDHPKHKDLPIIMVTTRATEQDRKKGEILGVSAYLTKPFQTNKLRIAVEEAVAGAQQRKEQEAIAKYVAADTLKAVSGMVEGSHSGKGEDKFITVLFSDICAFSGKCEKFSARKIVNLLNTYFELMVGVLMEHDAIIDKFIGDAIVARFDSGDPVRDARAAATASLGMLAGLKEFNLDAFEEINIRVGLNSGNVILGNLGCSKHRLEYAMIGDNVNIGQRLESSAPNGGCLISGTTYDLIKDYVDVGEKQELEVKGKAEKIAAYVLLGMK